MKQPNDDLHLLLNELHQDKSLKVASIAASKNIKQNVIGTKKAMHTINAIEMVRRKFPHYKLDCLYDKHGLLSDKNVTPINNIDI